MKIVRIRMIFHSLYICYLAGNVSRLSVQYLLFRASMIPLFLIDKLVSDKYSDSEEDNETWIRRLGQFLIEQVNEA